MSQRDVEALTLKNRSADGQSDEILTPTATMMAVQLDIDASGGTSPTLGVWMQWSGDGGNNWVDLPYDQQLTSNTAAPDLTGNTDKRNINGTALATGAGDHTAIYKHVPAGRVRAAYVIGGSSGPNFTFGVRVALT